MTVAHVAIIGAEIGEVPCAYELRKRHSVRFLKKG